MRKALSQLFEEAKARVAAMSPAELEAMHQAQRESWGRSCAPCEHGVTDWEYCQDCRSDTLNTPPVGMGKMGGGE